MRKKDGGLGGKAVQGVECRDTDVFVIHMEISPQILMTSFIQTVNILGKYCLVRSLYRAREMV